MAVLVIDLLFLQAKKSSKFFSNGRKVELVDVKACTSLVFRQLTELESLSFECEALYYPSVNSSVRSFLLMAELSF